MADLVESVGQDVLDEAMKKLDGRERDRAVSLGSKRDGIVRDREQAAVGDPHTVGVTAEVVDDVLTRLEGGLRVDVPPVGLGDLGHQELEAERIDEVGETCESSCCVEVSERGHQL